MSLVIALTVTGAVPVLRNTKQISFCHSMEKACSSGAGLSASAIFSMASRWRVAFASAFSAALRAFFEAFAYHQENAAPTMVKTAHTAMTTFAAVSISSSSVRCGGRTCSCGVDGTSQPTGVEAARTAGGGGLSGSSAVTPADRSAAEVPRYRFLRRREDDAARE